MSRRNNNAAADRGFRSDPHPNNFAAAYGSGWRRPHELFRPGTMALHAPPNFRPIYLDEVCVLEATDHEFRSAGGVFSPPRAVPYDQLQHSGDNRDLSGAPPNFRPVYLDEVSILEATDHELRSGGVFSPPRVVPQGQLQHSGNNRGDLSGAPPNFRPVYLDEVCILEATDHEFRSVGGEFSPPRAVPFGQLQFSGNNRGNLSGGLSEEEIGEKLKTRSSEGQDGKICVVCQEEIGRRIGILRCGHEYDASCIRMWLRHNNICPLCKVTAL